MQLSDTQLLILCSASQRNDHAAVLPANLKGGAAKKVVDRLLKEKLLQELRAKEDMPVWRRGDDNRPYSLRITKAGLRAIEVRRHPDVIQSHCQLARRAGPTRGDPCEEPAAQLAGKLLKGNCGRSSAPDEAK
jgi:hypothetical protein